MLHYWTRHSEGMNMNDISRRNFLKIGSIGALGVASAGLVGCAPKERIDFDSMEADEIPEYDICGRISQAELKESKATAETLTADEEETYDIVIVGAGTSGIPAGIAAAQAGANVCILQKENLAVAQGATVAYIDKGVTDDLGIAHLTHTIRELGCYRGRWELNELWAKNCTETVAWVVDLLKQAGCTDKDCMALPGADFEYPEGKASVKVYAFPFLGGIAGVIKKLAESYGDLMEIKYNTPGVQLIKEDGKVVGVYAEKKDGTILRVNGTKGVILATGDYQNNEAMVEKYMPDAVMFGRKQQNKTGDGHLMGLLAGAKMQPIGHCKMIHSSNATDTAHDFQSSAMLAVNKNGERFCAEDCEFTIRNNIVRNQPGNAWISIMDSKDPHVFEDLEEKNNIVGLEALEGVDEEHGVFKADTLEELAEKVGLPVDTFLSTVERYNELCTSNSGDLDFGKPSNFMVAVDTPPYYALYKEYQVAALLSGLEIDGQARVLDKDSNPIEGLYAIGNCSGPFYGCPDYPMDVPALSVSRCMTFGYVVGRQLANA